VVDLSNRLGHVLEVSETTRILVIEVSTGVLGLIVDAVDGVVEVGADQIETIPGVHGEDALGDEIVAIEDRLVMLLDPGRALGRLLPGGPAKAGGEAADADLSAPADEPKPPRAPPLGGPPPARRRSAAAPQVPRRRRRRHTKASEE
jgi:hypothetical protein